MELSGTSPPARLGWALQSLDASCLQCPRLSVGPSPRPPLVMGGLALGLFAELPHTFFVLPRLRPREGKLGRSLPETRFGRAETTPGGGAHRGHSAPRPRASAQGRTRLLPWGSRGIPAPTSHVGKLRPGQGQRSHIGGQGVPACKAVLTGVGTYATGHRSQVRPRTKWRLAEKCTSSPRVHFNHWLRRGRGRPRTLHLQIQKPTNFVG